MNKDELKKWAPLGAAAGLGLAAAGLGYTLVGRGPAVADAAAAQPAVELDAVVVARRPVSAGERLTTQDVTTIRIESGSRPESAYADAAALFADAPDGGRVAGSLILAGQPIMAGHLAAAGEAAGLAAMVPAGWRAMTVKLDGQSALGGFLKPDDRVDVVGVLRGDGGDAPLARAVVQDVRVLSVDGQLPGQAKIGPSDEERLGDEGNEKRPGVTLMVTPEQAARVDLALSSGSVRLVLRGGTDRQLTAFTGLTLADLRGVSAAAADERPVAFGETEGRPESTNEVAGLDLSPVDAAGPTTPLAEVAPPSTRPATRPADAAGPGHVVEIIRGGVDVERQSFGGDDATPDVDPFE